jgi:hypothetical protein
VVKALRDGLDPRYDVLPGIIPDGLLGIFVADTNVAGSQTAVSLNPRLPPPHRTPGR